MRSSKIVSLLLGVTMTFGLVTGCSKTSDKNAGKSSGTATIRFATWDSDETLTLQQQMVDKFNKENPDIKVVLEGYGSDYDTKIAAGIGAKDAPDVMYMWNYPQYGDALENLGSYIDKEGKTYKDNFYETLWNYNSKDSKILGMPVGYTTHVVYYNKALFDKAGVPYPTGEWTWQQLAETAKKVTNKQEKIYGFALSGKPDPYDFEMFLWTNGTQYVGNDKKLEGNLNGPKAVETLTLFQNMLKDGSAIATEGSGSTEMKTGKVAMFINGSWSINTLKENKINFGVAKLPSFQKDKKSVSIVSSSGVSMSSTSKNKDAAWKFIKYWVSEEANKARLGYELPVLKSVSQSENLLKDDTYSVFYKMLEQSSGFTPSSFKYEKWSELSQNLTNSFEQVFNSSTFKDPKKALDEAAK